MLKGKVVLVPFSFDDLSSSKLRPAACLTEPVGPHAHVVVAFITSQRPEDILATDLELNTGDARFASTGLRVPSTLRLHRLLRITTSLIRRRLGQLPDSALTDVDARLRVLFGLP
jgi:mRNA interferase MazF